MSAFMIPEEIEMDPMEIEPRDFKPTPKRTQILARATSAKQVQKRMIQLSPRAKTKLEYIRLQSARVPLQPGPPKERQTVLVS